MRAFIRSRIVQSKKLVGVRQKFANCAAQVQRLNVLKNNLFC